MDSLATRVEDVEATTPIVEKENTIVSEVVEKLPDNYYNELCEVGEAVSHFEMKTLTSEINDFVKSEMERRGLEGKKGYEEVIREYERKLHLTGADIYTRTEKIASLMRLNAKLLKTIEEKEQLLNGDPSKMTSSQLKQYIEGNNGRPN